MTAGVDAKTLVSWRRHWQGEVDAAFLYRELAAQETDRERADLYRRLADVEDKHVDRWEKVFRSKELADRRPRPSAKVRLQRHAARLFGSRWLLPFLVLEEAGEVKSYLALHDRTGPGLAKSTAYRLAQESVEHASQLSRLSGSGGEPWHRIASGDVLRNVVYGFNDGLTANFGLVAGVLGGDVSHAFVLLSGCAGMAADALSMGSSGYLAAKSQQEVYQHEIDMEQQELLLMPELEQQELALIYESKGMAREEAQRVAAQVMSDPARALEEKVREELRIEPEGSAPLRDGVVTGIATAVGALIPVAPFLFLSGAWAIGVSFTISMLSHFVVGAARSLFTGRGLFRSGLDMFAVGFGVAAVSYLVGDVLVRWVTGP